MVATDGSRESLRAVEWAVREAALLQRTPADRVGRVAAQDGRAALQAERDAVLGCVREQPCAALAAAAARPPSWPRPAIDTDPVEGQAARAVTESGSGALMLVVGFRGTGAFAAMALGSVARYADHGSCPVVVVRDEAAADNGWSASVSGTWRTAPMR